MTWLLLLHHALQWLTIMYYQITVQSILWYPCILWCYFTKWYSSVLQNVSLWCSIFVFHMNVIFNQVNLVFVLLSLNHRMAGSTLNVNLWESSMFSIENDVYSTNVCAQRCIKEFEYIIQFWGNIFKVHFNILILHWA